MRLDEIIEALPSVGLKVWRMDQGEDNSWHVVLEEREAQPYIVMSSGDGPTALEAMVAACKKAGVDVSDD